MSSINIGMFANLGLFPNPGFMPHVHCYLGTPSLIWTMFSTDMVIGLSYLGISVVLWLLVRKIKINFSPIILCFGVFIGACGLTHLLEAWTLWYPDYWLSAAVKMVTAVASVSTGIYLYRLRKPILDLADAASLSESRRLELEEMTTNLERRVLERTIELEQSEREFEATFEQAAVGIAHVGIDGRWLRLNKKYCEMLGYTEAELRGMTFQDVTHPDDVTKDLRESQQLVSGQITTYTLDKRYLRKDGTPTWVNLTGSLLRKPDGSPDYFVAVAVDRNEQRRLAEESARHMRMLRDLADSMTQLAWIADLQGHIFWYNRRWYEYTGTTFEMVEGWGWRRVHHPDHVDRVVSFIQEAWQKPEPWELTFPLRNAKGEWRWFLTRAVPLKDSLGNIVQWFATSTDIHDQKIYEDEIIRSKEQAEKLLGELESKSALLETMIEQLPMACVFAEAPSGKLIFANKQLQKIWRHPFIPSENFDGYREYIGFHPDGRRYDGHDWPLAKAMMTNANVADDVDVLFGDGTRGILRVRAAPVRNSQGKVVAGVVLCEDVTEQKRNEISLRLAKEEAEKANRLKSSFLANMSHEIRTPLGAMLGFADLLREPNLSGDERARYTDILTRNGEQLSVIINDILDLSKVEAGHLVLDVTFCDPLKIADDVVSLFRMKAEEKKLSIELRYRSQDIVPFVSDPVRVRQVLMNLVGNAVKFTESGNIIVEVSVATGIDNKHNCVFTVTDTGIGIQREEWEQIFDVFVQGDGSITRRFGGTGLGLALSRRLARVLGGDVRVIQSEKGQGSTFKFWVEDQAGIPSNSSNNLASTMRPKNNISKDTLKGLRTLLVDDSPDNRQLLSHYLTMYGASVDLAENGLEGYKKALETEYDVVLMDIQMPVMDGLSATAKLRSHGFSRPIIALTAHAMSDVHERCIEAGYTDHLPKPVNRMELIECIHRYARGHAMVN